MSLELCERANALLESAKEDMEKGLYTSVCLKVNQALQLWMDCLASHLKAKDPLAKLVKAMGFSFNKGDVQYQDVFGEDDAKACLELAESVKKNTEELLKLVL